MNDDNENQLATGNSYVLFSVTRENRKKRVDRIRKMAKSGDVLWAFLMTVFDFEWTVRRAILALSDCPTSLINQRLSEQKCHNWAEYCTVWNECVVVRDPQNTPILQNVLVKGFQNEGNASALSEVSSFLKIRHQLVHGKSGSAPKEKVDRGIEVYIKASNILCDYVESKTGHSIFQRIVRSQSRCKHCSRCGTKNIWCHQFKQKSC